MLCHTLTQEWNSYFQLATSSARHCISPTPLVMLHVIPEAQESLQMLHILEMCLTSLGSLSDFDGLILKLRSSKIFNIISLYTRPHLIMYLFPLLYTHAQTTSNYSLFSLGCLFSPLCLGICWDLLIIPSPALFYTILLIFHYQ